MLKIWDSMTNFLLKFYKEKRKFMILVHSYTYTLNIKQIEI